MCGQLLSDSKCPHCGKPGNKIFNGYCSKVHKQLNDKPIKAVVSCENCGRPVSRVISQLSPTGRVFCPRCPKNGGEQHYRWREGQYLNPAGYRLILVKDFYVLEHVFVWQRANKACLLKEARPHIHHVNMVKTDNYDDNLLLLSGSEHGRVHAWLNKGYKNAFLLLDFAGKRQLHYPQEILKFKN